jgi:hypothetical protein
LPEIRIFSISCVVLIMMAIVEGSGLRVQGLGFRV